MRDDDCDVHDFKINEGRGGAMRIHPTSTPSLRRELCDKARPGFKTQNQTNRHCLVLTRITQIQVKRTVANTTPGEDTAKHWATEDRRSSGSGALAASRQAATPPPHARHFPWSPRQGHAPHESASLLQHGTGLQVDKSPNLHLHMQDPRRFLPAATQGLRGRPPLGQLERLEPSPGFASATCAVEGGFEVAIHGG